MCEDIHYTYACGHVLSRLVTQQPCWAALMAQRLCRSREAVWKMWPGVWPLYGKGKCDSCMEAT